MHPVFFTFPDWFPLLAGRSIHFYGIMVALGFLFGMLYIQRESKRVGLNPDKMSDLTFGIIIVGLLGSRVFYVINEEWHSFLRNPSMFFYVWEGGLVFQGGVIFCIVFTVWYCRKHGISFLKTADVLSPALALGHALGRIGCFFAGCCYGKACPVDFPFGVVFPHIEKGIAPPGIPLYPTQLAESLGEFLLFVILLSFRRKKPFEGAVFLLYLILYAILRGSIEMFRGDETRGYFIEGVISHAQGYSILAILVSIVLWTILAKRQKEKISS